MRNEDLVGAWREIGREFVSGDGSVRPHVRRTSQLMYTPDGYMGVVSTPMPHSSAITLPRLMLGLMRLTRLHAKTALGAFAYAGKYEVDGDLVKHTVYSALDPDLPGSTQVRRATLAGYDLTLAMLPADDGSHFRIRWRRASTM